jgi:hypothetical protein
MPVPAGVSSHFLNSLTGAGFLACYAMFCRLRLDGQIKRKVSHFKK